MVVTTIWDKIANKSEIWDNVTLGQCSSWDLCGCRPTGFGFNEFGWQGGNTPWLDDGFGHGITCGTWSPSWSARAVVSEKWDGVSKVTTPWDEV